MGLIIFDLDGTLVDSIEGIAVSMNKTLESIGYKTHTTKTYKGFVGHGIKKLVEQALPKEAAVNEAMMTQAFDKMMANYRQFYAEGLYVYDGIEQVLKALKEAGHRLAVLTNKHQSMAEPIVTSYFEEGLFDMVVGRHESRPKKPDPFAVNMIINEVGAKKETTYFVGDSEVDYDTAINGHIKPIIVSWGFRELEQLKAIGAACIVDKPMEIINYIN